VANVPARAGAGMPRMLRVTDFAGSQTVGDVLASTRPVLFAAVAALTSGRIREGGLYL
jgi:hypothetical protein